MLGNIIYNSTYALCINPLILGKRWTHRDISRLFAIYRQKSLNLWTHLSKSAGNRRWLRLDGERRRHIERIRSFVITRFKMKSYLVSRRWCWQIFYLVFLWRDNISFRRTQPNVTPLQFTLIYFSASALLYCGNQSLKCGAVFPLV